ncbi:hypothetical protein LJB81_01645 [Desulfovibrio sp. OttesenSCG-928-M14]|nr:hypothetical protein [Desulfovibrio sp. OttesenSCG-928-M14]
MQKKIRKDKANDIRRLACGKRQLLQLFVRNDVRIFYTWKESCQADTARRVKRLTKIQRFLGQTAKAATQKSRRQNNVA